MCYRTRKYTVCRRVRVSFSPEIGQAGTVKGLIVTSGDEAMGLLVLADLPGLWYYRHIPGR